MKKGINPFQDSFILVSFNMSLWVLDRYANKLSITTIFDLMPVFTSIIYFGTNIVLWDYWLEFNMYY
jgi:hypothetical protein